MEKEKQELLDFSKRWDEAMVSNDAGEIGQFMAEDWKIVGSDGITSKSSFLQFIRSGLLTHNRMDSDETNITIYGNTGIVVSRGTSAGTYNGDDFSLYEWSTSVFIKTEGKWRCVITMLTPANKSE
jgi:ketosteroid isomerase-like protein